MPRYVVSFAAMAVPKRTRASFRSSQKPSGDVYTWQSCLSALLSRARDRHISDVYLCTTLILPLSRLPRITSLMGGHARAGIVSISDGRIESVTFSGAPRRAIQLARRMRSLPLDLSTSRSMAAAAFSSMTSQRSRRAAHRQAHRKTGTTGCLPTLITDRNEVIGHLADVAQAPCKFLACSASISKVPPLIGLARAFIRSLAIRLPDAPDLAAIKSFGGCGRSSSPWPRNVSQLDDR